MRDRGRRRADRARLRPLGRRGGGRGGRGRAAVRRRRRPRAARAGEPGRARGARRRRAPATRFGAAARAALASRPRRRARRAPAAATRQLALPLEPTAPVPSCREQTDWERMLADYGTTSLSVGLHPLELLRPHLPRATLSQPRAAPSHPDRTEVAVAGHGDRAPAARDRERGRLHAARGRARPGEPDRPAAGLRALPRRSSAASRCCSPAGGWSASGRNLNVLVRDARDARPARARGRRASRGAGARSRGRTTSGTAEPQGSAAGRRSASST